MGLSASYTRSVLAVGLGCLLAVAAASPTVAQERPRDTIDALYDALERLDVEAIAALSCPAYRDSYVAAFDTAIDLPSIPGLGEQAILVAVSLRVADREIDVIERDEGRAVVETTARIELVIDEPAMRSAIRAALEASGADAGEDVVEQALQTIVTSTVPARDIGGQQGLIRRDGRWLLCGPLQEGSDGATPAASDDATSLCRLMTVEELAELGPPSFVSSSGSPDDCAYQYEVGDGGEPYVRLDRYVPAGSVEDELRRMPWAVEGTFLDRPALLRVDTTASIYVRTDDSLLVVTADPGDSGVDAAAYVDAVATLAVPRYLAGQP